MNSRHLWTCLLVGPVAGVLMAHGGTLLFHWSRGEIVQFPKSPHAIHWDSNELFLTGLVCVAVGLIMTIAALLSFWLPTTTGSGYSGWSSSRSDNWYPSISEPSRGSSKSSPVIHVPS